MKKFLPPPTKFGGQGVGQPKAGAGPATTATNAPIYHPPPSRFGPKTAQTKPGHATTGAMHTPPATVFTLARVNGSAVQRMDTRLPFPFRYDNSANAPTTMSIESTPGGFLSKPVNHQPYWQQQDYQVKQSIAYNISYDDMPTGGKRAVSQGDIMGVSPNVAAKLLKLSNPQFPYWEWLHMIAFSIKPTHVDELSEESSDLLERTNQPQQISENLVLGTAASNTEMLSWETAIKSFAKKYPYLQLQLVAIPVIENRVVVVDGDTVTIPVCVRMKYDFNFSNPKTFQMTSPFVIVFDTLSHTKPSSESFETVKAAIKKGIESMTTLKELPQGIRVDKMHQF